MTFTRSFLPLLLLVVPPPPAALANSVMCDGPCVDTFPTMTCNEVISRYNFQTSACCFSFVDTTDGGCEMTTVGLNGATYCTAEDRTHFDCLASRDPLACTRMWHGLFLHPTESVATCPTTASYTPHSSSQYDYIMTSRITLSGISSLTFEAALEWEQLAANHTQDYINDAKDSSSSSLGAVFDVLASVRIDIPDDTTLVGDAADNTLTLLFAMELSWRGGDDTATATSIRNEAFNFPAGKQAFLTALQSSETFASVSNMSPVETVTETRRRQQQRALRGHAGQKDH